MKYVLNSQLTNLRMAAGNEKSIDRVVIDGSLKEWVGIGWVRIRTASSRDREVYPTAVDKIPTPEEEQLAQAQRAFNQNPTPALSTVIKRLAGIVKRQQKVKS